MGEGHDCSHSGFYVHPNLGVGLGFTFGPFTGDVGQDIGRGIGTVVEVDTTAFKSEQTSFIWIRVELPLDKPICLSGFVVNSEGDKVQVGFKYERLTGLCF